MYLKDLRCITGFPLSEIVIVDNSLLSFAMQPENGIPISSYFHDPADTELRCLAKYLLDKLAHVPDIRKVNSQEFNL